MRLLCSLNDMKQAEQLHLQLNRQGIANQVDQTINRDWGSEDYGNATFQVWIIDEDQAQKAYTLYENFEANPPEPIAAPSKAPPQPVIRPTLKRTAFSQSSPITYYLLIFCSLLFLIDTMTSPEFKISESSTRMVEPLYTSPIKEELLFDYPQAYALLAKLLTLFGPDWATNPNHSPQAQALAQEYQSTPYWQGIYALMTGEASWGAPLFEKLREGEVWRLISPIFLHGDIFHLLFNMLWLYVLGMQLEAHLGGKRYVAFIALTALFSNTCQYLMSGPNFIGISGVLCAMITFVYMRQRLAPWEGYQLQRSTFFFIMLFILGMFAIQLLSFLSTLYLGEAFATQIANTAHLSGALIGFLLGVTPYFTSQRREKA